MWMLMFGFLLFLLLLIYLLVFSLTYRQYKALVHAHRGFFRYAALAIPGIWVVEHGQFLRRFSSLTDRISRDMYTIHRATQPLEATKLFYANLLAYMYWILMFVVLISLPDEGNITYIAMGLFMIALLPILLIRRLNKQALRVKRAISLELPEFLNKLALLVGAGEPVQSAMIRCIDDLKSAPSTPLRFELRLLSKELANRYPFSKALEELSKRCAVQEVSIFTTTVLMNYRKGGDEFTAALRGLSRELWEQRKTQARMIGEEASAKLVFPMAAIFVVLMVIVAAPAIMLLND